MSIFNYQEQPGHFARLKEALSSTAREMGGRLGQALGAAPSSPVDENLLEELEFILIGSDIGIRTADEILEKVREQTRGKSVVTAFQLKRIIREQILAYLRQGGEQPAMDRDGDTLQVILVVGVNGVGKTTTAGKLALRLRKQGERVLLCAGDTFRAGAIEQLEIWAGRADCDFVKQRPGADPAAVLYDAIQAGRARNCSVLIADTAGRLHNKANLMAELEKIRRVASREVEGAPHEVLLVLDATTGQNGLVQAREFLKMVGVTGLIVTKLDGTAKGGILVAIQRELSIPVRFIGVGEQPEDLLLFSPQSYVETLLPQD